MRTGAEYRDSLRDGRKVWVMGTGLIDDVTTHPATRAMVDAYVAWYDLHFEPAWQDIALRPPDGHTASLPWAYVVPQSADDLSGLGRFVSATTFLSAGNITHTPCYGHLIALGVLCAVQERNVAPEQVAAAARYRELIASTGRFLTFCGGAPTIGARMRADPRERVALQLVRETDAGLVIRGQIGMHTSPAYAEDVYVGSLSGIVPPSSCPSMRPGSPRCAARSRPTMPTRLWHRSAAATTNSTARCGSTMCLSPGSAFFWWENPPNPWHAGWSGIICTAGCRKRNSPSA
jgi:aromatic ring hydroxylase